MGIQTTSIFSHLLFFVATSIRIQLVRGDAGWKMSTAASSLFHTDDLSLFLWASA